MHRSECVHERELLGRDVLRERGVVHHEPDSVVRQKEPEHILSYQVGQFAPEHDVASTQVSLDLVERGLDGPAF